MAITLVDSANAAASAFGTPPGDTKHTITKPASATTGRYLLILLAMSSAGTNVAATATDNSGTFTPITNLFDQVKLGSPSIEFYAFGKFIASSDPASWDFALSAPIVNAVSQYFVFTGVDPTNPISAAGWLAQAASNTSRITPSITIPANAYVIYGTHDRNGSNPTFPDAGTPIHQAPFGTAVAIASLALGIPGQGTYTKTMTLAAATSVAGSFIIALGQQATFATEPLATYRTHLPMEWGHRNCELDYPEQTLSGYASLSAYSATAGLEISARRTNDGVWVAVHDVDTSRVFSGTNLTIASSSWAQLQSKTTIIGNQPIAKMTDIMDAHTDRILMLDCKPLTNQSEFLDLMDAHGGPGRIMMKVAGTGSGSTAFADLAAARGYKTWGYFYQTDTGSAMDAAETHYDMIGMDYTANQAAWTQALGYGKQVLGHIVPNLAGRAVALNFGAMGIMASKATDGTIASTVPHIDLRLASAGIAPHGSGAIIRPNSGRIT